ncbi:tyrosine-type recombinase/integrase [Bradyrhizobium sp. CCGUVB4N]|uniref:tyrosine-type recombinase/integrase n=1 Tax=Bradyrhizobium sp. CCGUVB4N TaxID=2949631 RepID=UPI0020B21D61|nr:tyrosine-type recombinase/integrase [Bradyrhizobium sp. CCGUVB4N]MCP3385944.1 tyrosine-type recombinase/integrase [Bradyrhizobium sp. CCGUVB4N]
MNTAIDATVRHNLLKEMGVLCCNTIGDIVAEPPLLNHRPGFRMTLHGVGGARKYLNAAERQRFIRAAQHAPREIRLFCLTLVWGGARISEALGVTAAAIDLDRAVVTFKTLKRRAPGIVREVPLPPRVVADLNRAFGLRRLQRDPTLAYRRLWGWSRTTAWRYVKAVMRSAGLSGVAAVPKGLRHSFGVAAFRANIPPHLVQRWLGHASLETTAIYADVSGPEEREFAARMWRRSARRH